MNPIKTVLLTTDFSETSKKAFSHAREIAEVFNAEIVLMHVEEGHLPPLVIEYATVGLEELEARQIEHATEQLTALRPELGTAIKVRYEVARGTPHHEIVGLAESIDADLIVMATHGRGFISHAFLGSTAERVMRHAPCPVLVVRDKIT